ncbi:hypothetical protein QEN19_002281 [Hanseniaspora menglaensis]
MSQKHQDYYELLGVSQHADQLTIKKQYRKLALQYHPDKNPDRIEEYTELFAQLSIAYETLSDEQERAWYDSHKEGVLNESAYDNSNDATFFDVGISADDVNVFINKEYFDRYDNSVAGIYQVASRVFVRIATDEIIFGKRYGLTGYKDYEDHLFEENSQKSDFIQANLMFKNKKMLLPLFGFTDTNYKDVKNFYKSWNSFSTVKNFQWKNEYRIDKNYDRRTKRELNKRNEKIRTEHRNQYNKTVRNFVNFIKKLDTRLKLGKKKEQERIKEEQLKQMAKLKEMSDKQKKEGLVNTHVDEFVEQSWQQVDEAKLAKLEKEVLMQETILGDEAGKDEEDIEYIFECFVCTKFFKREKQLDNHEKSNYHKIKLEELKKEMLYDESELQRKAEDHDFNDEFVSAAEDEETVDAIIEKQLQKEDDDIEKLLNGTDDLDELQKQLNDIEKQLNNESEFFEKSKPVDIEPVKAKSKKQKKKQNRNKRVQEKLAESSDATLTEEPISQTEEKDQQIAVAEKKVDKEDELTKLLSALNETNSDDDWSTKSNKIKNKVKNKKNVNKNLKNEILQTQLTSSETDILADNVDFQHQCGTCQSQFSSRNMLFAHFKQYKDHTFLKKTLYNAKKRS